MKFAWDTNLVDFSGNTILDENTQPILLKTLVVQALMAMDKKETTGADKFRRYQLAVKVHKEEEIDVTEAALIKDVVGNVLAPLPVGRIWELLERPVHG